MKKCLILTLCLILIVEDTIQQSLISNCDYNYYDYNQELYCLKCKNYYYLTSDGKQCKSCLDNRNCLMYEENLYFIDQTSNSLCSSNASYYHKDFDLCLNCNDNCELCIFNKSLPICLKCKNDMILINNQCVCKESSFMHNNECISCKSTYGDGCNSCDGYNCSSCVSGCELSKEKVCICNNFIKNCSKYQNNLNFNTTSSVPIMLNNCYCYNELDQCQINCNLVYNVNNSKDIVFCNQESYYYSNERTSLLVAFDKKDLCSINNSNCTDCNALEGCLKCETGYKLNPVYNVCTKDEEICNINSSSDNNLHKYCLTCLNNTCTSCIHSHRDSEKFSCYYKNYMYNFGCNVNNCNECTLPNLCYECDAGYTAINNSHACMSCSSLIPFCKSCDGLVCKTCESGYVPFKISDERTICKTCSIELKNCESCEPNDENICSICKNGYFLYKGTCYPCNDYFQGNCQGGCKEIKCDKCTNNFKEDNFNGICLSCLSKIDCFECDSPYILSILNTKVLPCYSCSPGSALIFTSNGQKCVECHLLFEDCEACTGNYCTYCSDGYTVNDKGECESNTKMSITLIVIIVLGNSCLLCFIISICCKIIVNKRAREEEMLNQIIASQNVTSKKSKKPIFNLVHKEKCFNCNKYNIIQEDIEGEQKESQERQIKYILKFYETNCGAYVCNNCSEDFESKYKEGNYFRCDDCNQIIIGYKEDLNDAEMCSESIDKANKSMINIEDNKKDDPYNKNEIIVIEGDIKNSPTNPENKVHAIKKDEEDKSIKDYNNDHELCCICRRADPKAIIPCHSKPHHLVHFNCLNDLFNANIKNCPICKTELELPKFKEEEANP